VKIQKPAKFRIFLLCPIVCSFAFIIILIPEYCLNCNTVLSVYISASRAHSLDQLLDQHIEQSKCIKLTIYTNDCKKLYISQKDHRKL
jgi:hypothetical protein